KYGFVLETFKPYMEGQFWATNFFQGHYPVEEATFTAYVPKGKYYKFKVYNMTREEGKPRIEEAGNFVKLSWSLKNVPPVEREPSSPPMGELAKKVVITSLKSWKEVAEWYSELAKDAVEPDDLVKKVTLKVVKGKKSPEEKVRAIYDFVSKNIRYVGMEFGINGYKPHKASEVLKNRYGDCKDHATLLIAMLKVVGMKGYPVLIPTLSKADMDPEVPLPTAFNHEIAAIELNGKYFFMDTTSDYVPYGLLPPSDQGRNVLIVDVETESGEVGRTPIFPPDVNVEGFNGSFTLLPFGRLRGDMTFSYKGVYSVYERARLLNSTPLQLKRHAEELASKVSPGFEVERFEFSDYRNLDTDEVKVDISGKDSSYGTVTSHFILAKFPAPDYSRLVGLVASKERKYPYVIGYEFSKVTVSELKLPEGYRLYLKPENFYFKNRVGSISVEWSSKPGSLTMIMKMSVQKSVVPPEEYADLRELFNTTVKTLRNQIVVLEKVE
ncbi:MAG: transglutaminase domain-containing protein, partial [Desulfurobacteriaceae bacterium]